MIQVNVSEMKNRLSHYLRLARGGEEIQILDRKTPVARLIHVSQLASDEKRASWIQEMIQLGIVTSPRRTGFPADIFRRNGIPSEKKTSKVLEALLEERESGR